MYNIGELKEQYKKKSVTADEAAGFVKSGDRISFGLAHGAVVDFDIALSRRIKNLHDIEIFSTLPLRRKPFATYVESESDKQVRFNCCHFGAPERSMADKHRCWFLPIQFRELPKYWSETTKTFDIAVIQTGPIDSYGNFNIGPQVCDVWGYINNAKMIIVEVNENMPFAHGYQTELNLSDVDYVIQGSNTPLVELALSEPSDIERRIASNVVNLIESGSTLQLGIGGLPYAIGLLLCNSDIDDLSIHTEFLTDAVVDLYNAGKITGNKNIDKGKIVYGFCGGSKKLYDFIDHNPLVFAAPIDYVNSINVINIC